MRIRKRGETLDRGVSLRSLQPQDHDEDGALCDLDATLLTFPSDIKVAYCQALQRCPSLLGRDHKILFLKCERFNIELAALRLLRYWEKRLELFGDPKAFEPLTLDRALREDEYSLRLGMIQWTHCYDDLGRGIIFDDVSRFPPRHMVSGRNQHNAFVRRVSILRAWWYIVHAALEDERVVENGALFLYKGHAYKWRFFDRKASRNLLEILIMCLPIRFRAYHVCKPPLVLKLVIKFFFSPRMEKMLVDAPIITHSGNLVKSMEKHGLRRADIPRDLGGDCRFDYDKWLKQRRSDGL